MKIIKFMLNLISVIIDLFDPFTGEARRDESGELDSVRGAWLMAGLLLLLVLGIALFIWLIQL
jgi:hypothetical protein